MSLQKELTAALKKLERERGLPFPPWRVTPQLEVVVQQTDEDEREYPADFLEAECEGRSKKDRAAAVREAAEGLAAMLDEPPGTVRFESSWSDQLSLLPRALLAQLGKRLITRRAASRRASPSTSRSTTSSRAGSSSAWASRRSRRAPTTSCSTR